MSNVSNDTTKTDNLSTASEPKDEKFVAKSAYEEVSKDMHKFKSKAKEAEAKAAELEARMKAIEEAKLIEEKRFEELYQKERQAKEAAEAALKNTNEHLKRSVKMTALIKELGGKISPKYLVHADLNAIIVHEDGSLSSESVVAVANKFRQENPELVPSITAGNLNDVAPAHDTLTKKQEVSFENLTRDQLRDIIAKAPVGTTKKDLYKSN
jgi:hypothetical protein